jgi:hypothetical protein
MTLYQPILPNHGVSKTFSVSAERKKFNLDNLPNTGKSTSIGGFSTKPAIMTYANENSTILRQYSNPKGSQHFKEFR